MPQVEKILVKFPFSIFLLHQVGNIKPATEIAWFKDGIEIEEDDEDAKKIGKSDEVLIFDIGKVRLGWAMIMGCVRAGIPTSV